MSALGRREPLNYRHVAAYPLTAATTPSKPVPVTIGVDWHTSFDSPKKKADGRWWLPDISKGEPLGGIRGGHCVCLRPDSTTDLTGWWDFYNQGAEGACVGFGSSRMMSLLNRARYDGRWLYKEAQRHDYWPGEAYEGTSVSAAMDVLRTQGHKTMAWTAPRPAQGINANRWAQSLDDIRACLQSPRHDQLQAVPLLNSWGRNFPHISWLPYSTLTELVVNRGGEATVVVDR